MSNAKKHQTQERMVIKIVILGASNVGKSSLMKRYTSDKFSDTRRVTIGTDFMTKKLIIEDREVLLQVIAM